MDFLGIFITGLTVGGLTCLAVQGGLLASTIASKEGDEHHPSTPLSNSMPVIAFLASKLVAYTILGFLLGSLGQTLAFSEDVRIWMQLFAGLYMIAIALDLLKVHPIFKFAVIQSPRFFTRLVRNQSKSKQIFAPLLLGFLTIFIPCGTTLAMEALAISTGNPLFGAGVMFFFVLGTIPVFFSLGYLTSTLSQTLREKFLKFAAFIVIYLGVTSVNGALVALGSPLTLQNLYENSPIQIDLSGGEQSSGQTAQVIAGVQNIEIKVTSGGYSPSRITVNQNQPVRLKLTSTDSYSCASNFRIPSLGIAKNLRPNDEEIVEFTPKKKGKLTFTCSMGMFTGAIEVI